jgi:hypothetical protein
MFYKKQLKKNLQQQQLNFQSQYTQEETIFTQIQDQDMNGGNLMIQPKDFMEHTVQMNTTHTIQLELMPPKTFPESQTQISTNLLTTQSFPQMVTTKDGSTKTIKDFTLK